MTGFHPFAHKAFIDGSAPPEPAFATSQPTQLPPNHIPPNQANSANALPTAYLTSLAFSLLRPDDIHRLSHLHVINRSFYEANGSHEAQRYGVLDKTLGVSGKTARCHSCGKGLADCIGHSGHIQLVLPVFHIGYFKEIVKVLQQICKNCGRIMLNNDEISRYTKLYIAAKGSPNEKQRRTDIHQKMVIPATKKHKLCPHCDVANGVVKKITTAFRITHELRFKEAQDAKHQFIESFNEAVKHNPAIKEFLSRTPFDLNPLWVWHLFVRIPSSDCLLLNFDPLKGRPESMIITSLIVPPACIRPSVSMGVGSSNEDDLTVKLGDIIFINNVISTSIEKGATVANIIENWDFLQQQCAMYVNADLPGFPKAVTMQTKPIRALIQRLKGKQGRFRGNLSGKRVDFSSRTVISPDPNLRVDEVGVPELVAKVLTYPERVHPLNIEAMRKAVINGPDVWPGANTVELLSGVKIALRYGKRDEVAKRLCYGDIVERHVVNGDVVLFNRQPSLHRLSIMAHRARVLKWRTFRFNECCCTPYNADFDGDEMNLHVPQTEEARIEALQLMGVKRNLVTPRHGEPLIAATQDFITTSYLITQKDVFYDRSKFCQIATFFSDAMERIDIPPPAIMKPQRLWTGKQIASLLLKPNNDPKWPIVNAEFKERNYTRDGAMCARDGFVVIRNSEHLAGNWAKDTVGGNKSGLLYSLIRDHSDDAACELLNRLAKMSARWIGDRGFSIGIDDVTPSDHLIAHKARLLAAGYALCSKQIDLYQRGELTPASGCNEEQTLESSLLGELSQIREELGSFCLKELNYQHNSPLIMAICGSKGSKINISQMISAVGQQAVSGSRIPEGFVNRTLPHFKKKDRSPAAKGFVENSFYSGLTGTEFFFHTMGGREGLVDTAVKTAETGYMQRRLMKALEDLCVQYDNTVRTSESNIVQFVYGDDGLDPLMMTQGHQPVQFGRLMEQSRAFLTADKSVTLYPTEIDAIIESQLADPKWQACSGQFILKLREFLKSYRDELQLAMDNLDITTTAKANGAAEEDAVGRYVIHQTRRLTRSQLVQFMEQCYGKYHRSRIEPGTSVGAIGAQSIGEPGTQMTLKTFHFAGVASMNITLGVPRIKEVINAAKKISTPIITAPLVADRDVKAARIVKGRIERTTLGEISKWIEEVVTAEECFIEIQLDLEAIEGLQLAVDSSSIAQSISLHKKLKWKGRIEPRSASTIRIYSSGDEANELRFALTRLVGILPSVVICGVSNVNRAVINDVGGGKYNLLVEGYNLLGVMGTLGVEGATCASNHVDEMQRVLGIEAARATIIREIQTTMDGHGLTIDYRHVALMADIMCYRGRVLGITRFGVAQMKESVLMLASFEKTADHLFEAAVRGTEDHINGVSECIIMGTKMPVGTGLFQLVHRSKRNAATLAAIKTKPSPQLLLHHSTNPQRIKI